jgi:hypothetical protein
MSFSISSKRLSQSSKMAFGSTASILVFPLPVPFFPTYLDNNNAPSPA